MKNNKLTKVFVILFTLLLLIPAVSMPFFSGSPNTEKRSLARFPKLISGSGKLNDQFGDELSSWAGDHIGFRSVMINGNVWLQTQLLGRSPEESVILGKEGWLYYSDTLNDYLNIPTMSSRNAANVARTMALLQEHAESQGSEFVVALIPNKNSIYGEYMPAIFRNNVRDQQGNLELIQQAMAAEGVNFANVQQALESEASTRTAGSSLYQHADSHWTYEGALLGYRTIFAKVLFPTDPFDGLTFRARSDWDADLSGMLYASKAEPAVQQYPDIDFTYEVTSDSARVDAIALETHNEEGSGSVVIYRDSFLNTMQVFVAGSFENAFFSRSFPYDMTLADERQPDVTVVEIVERNLGTLAQQAPLMEAPKTEAEEVRGSAHCLAAQEAAAIIGDVSNGLIHFYGTIDPSLLGDEYRVFLQVSEDEFYEAFPIYEKALLEKSETASSDGTAFISESCDNGFSAYLPADLITTDGTDLHIWVMTLGD